MPGGPFLLPPPSRKTADGNRTKPNEVLPARRGRMSGQVGIQVVTEKRFTQTYGRRRFPANERLHLTHLMFPRSALPADPRANGSACQNLAPRFECHRPVSFTSNALRCLCVYANCRTKCSLPVSAGSAWTPHQWTGAVVDERSSHNCAPSARDFKFQL